MNGAEALISAAISEGIEVCFANPGTTEMPFVAALDSVSGIRPVLCLHENVCTGAADGFARMTGKPAMTLLHLGPGLSNGLTNLHNARRAHTPLVNVVGEHASWHLPADPLLATNIEWVARTASDYVKENLGASTLAADMVEAVAASKGKGGRIATLVVPHDSQWEKTEAPIPAPPRAEDVSFSADAVATAGKALQQNCALLLGGEGLSEDGLQAAGRLAAKTDCTLICDTFFARMERGGGLPKPKKLPYFPEQAIEMLAPFDAVIIAGTRRPVAFFGYQDGPSYLTADGQEIVDLTTPGDDLVGALEALARELGAPGQANPEEGSLPPMPTGNLDAAALSAVIANLQPEGAIVMDESLTAGTPYHDFSDHAPRFTHLMLTGGAIGMGPGAATGAALACPGRKVINFQADGSGAYSVQALWTQAREALDVVTVIASNRSYNILNFELMRAGIHDPGPSAVSLSRLDNPDINWSMIAEGFGVPGTAVDTAEALARELEAALSRQGPSLIEAVMA